MPGRIIALLSIAVLVLLWTPDSIARQQPAPSDPASVPEQAVSTSWIRLTESENRVLKLDVAARSFTPSNGQGPTITLTSAVHIGDRSFYRQLQHFLDAKDLVLFEGVAPPGTGEDKPDTNEQRQNLTRHRLRLLAILVEQYHTKTGAFPPTLDDIGKQGESIRAARFLETARFDGWNHPMTYTLSDEAAEPFELRSAGPNGTHGDSDDLLFSAQDPLSPDELGDGEGIQQKLARTFGLHFQIDEMDESGPNWVNSDLSIDEVQQALEDRGADGSFLFNMLDGSSFSAKFASMFLSLIEVLPGASVRGKAMMMEMLSEAEDIMFAGMPGGEALGEVIIGERNQRVIDDLRKVLETERAGELRNVAVLYGAGHMKDLAERLINQLDYQPRDTTWFTAIGLDLERAGISRFEMTMLRGSIRRQLRMMEQRATQN